jgi:hypothetical protein
MSTNHFFNNYPKNITSEQLLIEDLVIEAIQISGMDLYYLPRTSRDSVDYLYGEDQLKQYITAYPIEMYLENVNGMEGEGDFISKFGLEIRDECTFLVSRRRFKATIPDLIRPNEGDIIYIPLLQNFFEITFCEHENNQTMFYTLGRGRGGNVYVYALKMKQLLFSNEIIQTGIKEIDDQIRYNYPKTLINLTNINGKFLNDEIIYQGTDYANNTVEALVYDYIPNISMNVYRTIGSFSNTTITGITSGATADVILYSDMTPMDNAYDDIMDNNRIKTAAEPLIDFSNINPFGEP